MLRATNYPLVQSILGQEPVCPVFETAAVIQVFRQTLESEQEPRRWLILTKVLKIS